MATQVQWRRGTTAEHSTFTGIVGEVTVDTTKDTLVVHDAVTAGGVPLLREDLANNTNVVTTTNPISSGTANGVAYLNGSKALTTGSALTFDGANLGVGAAATDSNSYGRAVDSIGVNGAAYYARNSGNNTVGFFGAYFGAFNSVNVGSSTNSDIVFYRQNSEQMRLTSTGLGIGTTNPTKKLEVAGSDALIHGVTVGRGSGAVATNTVVGSSALASNTTGYDNTANGVGALYYNTIGLQNTASGLNALYYNTTGSQNTASGLQALCFNTTGGYNTASGMNALLSNTTGYQNTASGANALRSNTTGSQNTASGQTALYSNTTGNYNTASGQSALQNNTTGIENTASGQAALFYNTTGSYNTADGFRALFYNTTGYQNIAIGGQALHHNTTGYHNTATGQAALYSNTTGNYNTAFGSEAGYLITTGSNNTIIGRYNGNQGGLDIRTANNYIVLSDGDGNPWSVINGSNGTASMRQHGFSFLAPVMKVSGFGYAPYTYRAIVIGGAATAGTYNTLCFGYDPAGNTNGNFSGVGNEVFFPNGIHFKTPNSTDTNFHSVLSFDSDGYGLVVGRSVGVGGAAPSSSGTGITFPATQNASSNANTLDDYEEGTWTPTFGLSTTDPTVSYTAQAGWYVKVGRLVTVFCDMTASSISGGFGVALVRGLPFPSSAVPSVPTFMDCSAVSSGGTNTMLFGFVQSSHVQLGYNSINGTYGYAGSAGWNASGRVVLSATYYAAS